MAVSQGTGVAGGGMPGTTTTTHPGSTGAGVPANASAPTTTFKIHPHPAVGRFQGSAHNSTLIQRALAGGSFCPRKAKSVTQSIPLGETRPGRHPAFRMKTTKRILSRISPLSNMTEINVLSVYGR